MLSLNDNPPSRWPEGRALIEDLGHWWVARVRPRNEKALATELSNLGISYYLPMLLQKRQRRDNGKIRKSVVCAFPGYIPLVGYSERKFDILRSNRVLRVIWVPDQARFVQELESVRIALQFADMVEVYPALAAGQRVKIISGPLRGIEGVVIDAARRDKFFLNVELFQRALVVSVSPEHLMFQAEKQ